jgi:hypothetical protein
LRNLNKEIKRNEVNELTLFLAGVERKIRYVGWLCNTKDITRTGMEGTSADASFDGEILYETRHTASFFLSYKIEYHPPDG